MRKKGRIVSYSAEELTARREDGATHSDWARAAAMTDDEIEADIASDPDEVGMAIDWSSVSAELPQPMSQLRVAIEAAWEKHNLGVASIHGGERLVKLGLTRAKRPDQNISKRIQRMTRGYTAHDGNRGFGPFFERVAGTDQIRPLYSSLDETLRRAGVS